MDPLAPRRRPRRLLLFTIIGVAVVAVVAGGLLIARNGQANNGKKKGKKDEAAPPPPVELTTVGKGAISTFLETTTVLEAVQQRGRSSRAARARSSRCSPRRAARSRRARCSRASTTPRRGSPSSARRSTYEQAERDAERGKTLLEQRRAQSAQAMDDLTLKLAHREAEPRAGRVRPRADAHRRAVLAARSSTRMIQLGETVTPGSDCFRVDDFDPLLARVYFPERDQAAVRVGQTADARRSTAHPGRDVPGAGDARQPGGRPHERHVQGHARGQGHGSGVLRPGQLRARAADQRRRSPTRSCCREGASSPRTATRTCSSPRATR